MKVLWFTNIPLTIAGQTASGGWMAALADALIKTGQIELCSVSFAPGKSIVHRKETALDEWILPIRRVYRLAYSPSNEMVSNCLQIVDQFCPDVVHIHGTEQFYGLLTEKKNISIPSVISIQGLIHVCRRYFLGGLSWRELIEMSSIRDWYRWDGPVQTLWRANSISKNELSILNLNKNFIGRTLWDHAHLFAINPTANYFSCDELMREAFYTAKWEVNKSLPHTILVPSSRSALKGSHWVLRAAAILKHKYQNIEIRIVGSKPLTSWRAPGYQRWIFNLIHRLELDNNVVWLGNLNQQEMALELEHANVCAIGSMVENSSNALAEAMLVGTPIVCSFAGGNPSLVQDRDTALCYPPGDEAVMAECISSIFDDNDLAVKLSERAKEVASIRHDKQKIVNTMLAIYQEIIKNGL